MKLPCPPLCSMFAVAVALAGWRARFSRSSISCAAASVTFNFRLRARVVAFVLRPSLRGASRQRSLLDRHCARACQVQRIYQGLPKTVQLVFEGRSLTQVVQLSDLPLTCTICSCPSIFSTA
eukprot:3814475-Pleurochrysis_carterae.AAC.3